MPKAVTLQNSVQYLKGVGPHVATLLGRLQIHSIIDVLYHFPLRYLDRRQVTLIRKLLPGEAQCIMAEVVGGASRRIGASSRKKIYELLVKDETGTALVTWFHFNEKYLERKYPPGTKLFIAGTCQMFGAKRQFAHPDIEELDDHALSPTHPIVAVYPATEGLHQKTFQKIVAQALPLLEQLEETPLSVRKEGPVKISLKEALQAIHTPPAEADVELLNSKRSAWHQRIAYDEAFYLQLGLQMKKRQAQIETGIALKPAERLPQLALSQLPFELTGAQKRVIEEIKIDLARAVPMNRLLQGDVGSGKTLVAFITALQAIESGYQAALMVPTEILAEQHTKTLLPLAEALKIPLACLTGSTSEKDRKTIAQGLESGQIAFLIGTHALIQETVNFKELGYVMVDEQHRFGVRQRAALRAKGVYPHILVLTATPIPRTLSMSFYGDLDVSQIDELPKGRQPIQTRVLSEKLRRQAYILVGERLAAGEQAYFIYPLVQESEKLDLKNATEMAAQLALDFPGYRVGLLHGRMKADEKAQVMADFKAKKTHILVSTTVVEVGVDVPNATVMVIEHAERFGLSQLHQLRGRVGRGTQQSYCILIAGYAQSEETRYRLRVMEETNDGFQIAEEDLKIRGPGDFLGTQQAGLPPIRLWESLSDTPILEMARNRAHEVLSEDPKLTEPKHEILRRTLKQRWEDRLELAAIS